MDTLDIVIVAAAAVGIIAFLSLAVVIVLQGRALKRLEERVGPPVPMGAAPSLERVRAIAAQPEVRVDIPDDAVGQPASGGPGVAPAGEMAAPVAASAAAERAAERKGQRTPPSTASSARGDARGGAPDDGSNGGGNGALIALIAVLVVAILAVGGWFFFLRGDGGSPATGTTTSAASSTRTGTTGGTGTAGTTATTPDTASTVPEEVPPVANKAAYTVAVLNASGVSGAAANRVAPRVQAAGYTLGVVDNATQQNLPSSEVQYVAGRKEVAWNVAKDLGITMAGPVNALAEGRIGTADVAVIVGKDLSK